MSASGAQLTAITSTPSGSTAFTTSARGSRLNTWAFSRTTKLTQTGKPLDRATSQATDGFCRACFDGIYPIETPEDPDQPKFVLEDLHEQQKL